tara:strand:+ start:80 stop:2557 length:2478 start_codon:yes stop_codon:yes gene_type:complete
MTWATNGNSVQWSGSTGVGLEATGFQNNANVTMIDMGEGKLFTCTKGVRISNPFTSLANEHVFVTNAARNAWLVINSSGVLKVQGYIDEFTSSENIQNPNWLSLKQAPTAWDSAYGVQVYGKLSFEGGYIRCNSPINALVNGIIKGRKGAYRGGVAASGNKTMIRLAGGVSQSVDFIDFIAIDYSNAFSGATVINLTKFSPRNAGEGLLQISTKSGANTYISYNPENVTTSFAAISTSSFYIAYGSPLIPLTFATHFNHTTATGGGSAELRKKIRFTLKSFTTGNAVNGKVYMQKHNQAPSNGRSYANSFYENLVENEQVMATTPYIASSTSGVATIDKILAYAGVTPNENVGLNSANRGVLGKTKATDHVYKDDAVIWIYGYSPVLLSDIDLTGLEEFVDVAVTAFDDVNITETNSTTVAAYTTSETAAKFVDLAALNLATNRPASTTHDFTLAGTTVTGGANSITASASGAAYAFAGTTATINAASFNASITTTGSVSLVAIAESQTITSSQNVTLATLPTALTLDNAILNLPAGADVTAYVETNGGSYKATADGTYTARGKASSIIAANGFTITVVTAAAPTPSTLNFTANSARWAIYNNSGTFIESGTGDKTLNHSAGVDAGTWKIISHRKGYVAQINTWSADDGTTNGIAFAGTQIVRPEGGVAYTTATTPNTTISISASRVHTLIGNLSISTQELVNVQQNFLNTDAGLAWIEDTSTTAAPTHGNLGGTAFFLNLTGFTYDSTTGSTPESAVNATLVSSASHANVVTTNGGTIFGGGSASAADIAALVWASSNQTAFNTLASSLATRVDVQAVENQIRG